MGTSWNTEAIKLYAYQLGKRIARQRLFKVMPTTDYCLFNGVKLRNLPEATKPYAVIVLRSGTYYLYYRDNPVIVNSSGTCVISASGYKYENDEWVESGGGFSNVPIWANHDVYYTDAAVELGGTIYLHYSDPVPVHE